MDRNIVIALLILAVMVVLYMTEWIPLVATAVLGCFAFYITGIIDANTALAGFSNNTVLMIVGILITGTGLSASGFSNWLGQKLIRIMGTSERKVMAYITLGSGIMSAFIQNGACNSAFLPMIDSISVSSNGRIKSKHLVLPMGLAVGAGGLCTMIGSTPQLISQGLLESSGFRPFYFAELALAGVPILLFAVAYYCTIGYKIIEKTTAYLPDKEIEQENLENVGKQNFTFQMGCSAFSLVFLVLGLSVGIWTTAWVALIASMIVIVGGCVKPKVALSKVNWNSVFIIACTMGVGKGLTASGAAEFLANSVSKILGENASALSMLVICGLLVTIMGNFMSHTSILTLMVPVFIPIAQVMQLDVTLFIFAITAYTSSAAVIPLGKASYTMTMSEGYTLKDYARINWVINVAAFIIITVISGIRMAI